MASGQMAGASPVGRRAGIHDRHKKQAGLRLACFHVLMPRVCGSAPGGGDTIFI